MNKKTSVCLTGHRPKSLPWGYNEKLPNCKAFKKDLKELFSEAINYGFKIFYTGMAEGFDMIGTEILIKLRKFFKEIKIVAVIPCENQPQKWSKKQQKRYKTILKKCNEKIVISNQYTPTCMMERNKFLVNNSSLVIACFNGNASGTGKTIKYAKEKGLKIKIITPTNYQ